MRWWTLVVAFALGLDLVISDVVTTPAAAPKTTPSEQLQDLVALLHRAFQANPQLHQLVDAAEQIPDNVTLPLSQELQSNPIVGIALKALSDLASSTNVSSAPNGSTVGGGETAAPQPSIDIVGMLMASNLLQDVIRIVGEEMQQGMLEASKDNKTVGTDMMSMLGVVNPLTVLQEVLKDRSAAMILPPMPGVVSEQCRTDLVDTLDALVAPKKWAIDMFDALGKPTSGIQRGSFYFVGSFDQCYMIEPHINVGDVLGTRNQTKSRDFGTRFCRSDIAIPPSMIDSLNVDTKGVHLKLILGMCVPDSCHKQDIATILGSIVTLEDTYCYEDINISSDTSAIVCIVILSLFLAIIMIGTLFDACRSPPNTTAPKATSESQQGNLTSLPTNIPTNLNGNYEHLEKPRAPENVYTIPADVKAVDVSIKQSDLPPGYVPHRQGEPDYAQYTPTTNGVEATNDTKVNMNGDRPVIKEQVTPSQRPVHTESVVDRIALSFSLYTNVPKLLSARSSPGAVACVHGIRFLSLTWVVLGHTYNYGIVSMDDTFTADNLLDFVPVMQRFTFQGVQAGGFSVDTFFVLSAFLLTWLQLKDLKKKRRFTCLDGFFYYFHRFWRLTPLYMMVLMMFGCLYRYLGTGPFWPSTIWAAEHCKTTWWTNLLYVNNLVEEQSQCMGWTWYLANDMQFYVISPIFLALMYKLSIVGVLSTVGLLAGGVGIAYWQEHIYNGNFFTMKSDDGAYWTNVYTVPWCRVSPWAVGMLLGYIVFKRGNKPLRHKFIVYAGWLVATGVALFVTYINYTEQKKDGTPWTREQRAAYESFGRAAWGVCVAWVIFACHTGSGGIVNSILSWNGFIPLSRLSYAAYLVHPICMMTYFFSRRTMFHVTDYNIIYLFLGHLSVAYMVAFVCSLAFEAPFMALEKVLFRPSNKRK